MPLLRLCNRMLPMHSEQVVPYAIKLLQSKGYQLVTVAECLGLQAYINVTTPETPEVASILFASLPISTHSLSLTAFVGVLVTSFPL